MYDLDNNSGMVGFKMEAITASLEVNVFNDGQLGAFAGANIVSWGFLAGPLTIDVGVKLEFGVMYNTADEAWQFDFGPVSFSLNSQFEKPFGD